MQINKIINRIRLQSRENKLNQFFSLLKPVETDAILEVGITNIEYSPTDNFFIKNYPYRNKITALGIGNISTFEKTYPDVSTVSYDGRTFPFEDKQFEIVHSNAVIEHVGPFECQVFFIKEMVRVANLGMFTTPNRYFPIEQHTKIPFLHWLPKIFFDRILKLFGKSWAANDYMYLLGFKDLEKMMDLAGFDNYSIMRNNFCGITMTFTVVWDCRQVNE